MSPHDQAFQAALEKADLAALRQIPKGDLHVHGLLGGRLANYQAFAQCPLPQAPAVFADFKDFDKYLLQDLAVPYWGQSKARVLEFFRFLLADTIKEAIDDGVRVIEPSLDCTFLDYYDDDALAMVADFQRVFDSVLSAAGHPAIEIRPELGMARGVPLAVLERYIPLALSTGFFQSVDLYGDERVGGVVEYLPFFRLAADAGLRRKAHAGELCSAERVRESVLVLDLNAVQHGIAAAASPALMEFLAKRGTVLNVCPTSNVRLGCVPSLEHHPARTLHDAGVTITINTDDLLIFNSSVSEEFLKLHRAGLFSATELNAIRLNSLK